MDEPTLTTGAARAGLPRVRRRRLFAAAVVVVAAAAVTAGYRGWFGDNPGRALADHGIRIPDAAADLDCGPRSLDPLERRPTRACRFTVAAGELDAFLRRIPAVFVYYPGWYSGLGYRGGVPGAAAWPPTTIASQGSLSAPSPTGSGELHVEWQPSGSRVRVTLVTR